MKKIKSNRTNGRKTALILHKFGYQLKRVSRRRPHLYSQNCCGLWRITGTRSPPPPHWNALVTNVFVQLLVGMYKQYKTIAICIHRQTVDLRLYLRLSRACKLQPWMSPVVTSRVRFQYETRRFFEFPCVIWGSIVGKRSKTDAQKFSLSAALL